MVKTESITFVVSVNNDDVYKNNFLASPLIKNNKYEIISQRGYLSASKAYNDAIKKSNNEIIVFTHQDVIFPKFWGKELFRSLAYLNEKDPNWGVIGCYGHDVHGDGFGYMYCYGNKKLLGKLSVHPIQVQTLDEVVLILKKSSELRFDDSMPNFHLYGADICLNAACRGKTCYAISAFCLHNTNKLPFLPSDFFKCYKYIKDKWYKYLPIDTTCIRIEKYWTKQYLIYKYVRRLKYKIMDICKRNEGIRSKEPITLLSNLENNYMLYRDE